MDCSKFSLVGPSLSLFSRTKENFMKTGLEGVQFDEKLRLG